MARPSYGIRIANFFFSFINILYQKIEFLTRQSFIKYLCFPAKFELTVGAFNLFPEANVLQKKSL